MGAFFEVQHNKTFIIICSKGCSKSSRPSINSSLHKFYFFKFCSFFRDVVGAITCFIFCDSMIFFFIANQSFVIASQMKRSLFLFSAPSENTILNGSHVADQAKLQSAATGFIQKFQPLTRYFTPVLFMPLPQLCFYLSFFLFEKLTIN